MVRDGVWVESKALLVCSNVFYKMSYGCMIYFLNMYLPTFLKLKVYVTWHRMLECVILDLTVFLFEVGKGIYTSNNLLVKYIPLYK